MAKMCTASRLERQFATLYLFHVPTPPPLPKSPKYPPPPKTRNFMDMEVFLQTERQKAKIPGAHKLARPFPAPELRTKHFTDTRILLSNGDSQSLVLSGLQKGPAERGHVKNRQKVSKSFFDTFRQFSRRAKNVKNRQKMSKSSSTLFDNFRAAPFFRPLLGGSEVLSPSCLVSLFKDHLLHHRPSKALQYAL